MGDDADVGSRPMLTVMKSYSRRFAEGDGETAEATEDEFLDVRRFETAPAEVGFSAGLTLNLGNYESARIDVSVKVPCYREELDEAYAFATKWASDRLVKEREEIRTWKQSKDVGF